MPLQAVIDPLEFADGHFAVILLRFGEGRQRVFEVKAYFTRRADIHRICILRGAAVLFDLYAHASRAAPRSRDRSRVFEFAFFNVLPIFGRGSDPRFRSKVSAAEGTSSVVLVVHRCFSFASVKPDAVNIRV